MNCWWPVEVEREYPSRQVKVSVLSPVEAEERPSEVVVQAFGLFLLTRWYPTQKDAERVRKYYLKNYER